MHTYTALMNVCIKCQNCPRALETYNTMRQSGCFPNVVTYNTLIECVQPLLMSESWPASPHDLICLHTRMEPLRDD